MAPVDDHGRVRRPPGPRHTTPPSRLRRGLLALVAAIVFVSLWFVAFIVNRDSGPDTESPLEDQPTVSVPAYTGDWKDFYVGRPTARSSYTGDWKDAFVGK